jgi:hypothetical protein
VEPVRVGGVRSCESLGADFEVGVFRLVLAVPEFALDFDKSAFLQAGCPPGQLRPKHARVPLRPAPVFAGILILPADVVAMENREQAVPFVVKRASASFPRCPMRVMRFLQNIFVVSFLALFGWGDPERGSCPQGLGTLCWERPSRTILWTSRKKPPLGLGAGAPCLKCPDTQGRKEDLSHVSESSLTHRFQREGTRTEIHEERRDLYGPVARHQDILEKRQRRMGVPHGVASNHRLVEAW